MITTGPDDGGHQRGKGRQYVVGSRVGHPGEVKEKLELGYWEAVSQKERRR